MYINRHCTLFSSQRDLGILFIMVEREIQGGSSRIGGREERR